MARIEMYTTPWCGFCVRAKKFLDAKGLAYEEIFVDESTDFRAKLFDLTGQWTVPQILIDSKPIGGYVELRALDREGLLDELVDAA